MFPSPAPGPAAASASVTRCNEIVARYGLLTEGDAPVTAGDPPAGSLRVVVSRSKASVPGCPNWKDRSQADLAGAQAIQLWLRHGVATWPP